MSEASKVNEILGKAKEEERRYEWLKAADYYQEALKIVPDSDSLMKGEISESLAYAVYKAAFQADNDSKFKERMRQAAIEYEKSSRFYGLESDPKKLRSDAFQAFSEYWLVTEPIKKKELLSHSWILTQKALKRFEETGNALEYGTTYCNLSPCAFLDYSYEWDFHAGEKTIRGAMEYAERAVVLLSEVKEPQLLARVYVRAAFYLTAFGLYFVPDMDERQNYFKKGNDYWQRAEQLSEEAALLELANTSGGSGDEMGFNTDENLERLGKALELACKTRDKYLIGNTFDWLTYNTQWKAIGLADVTEALRLDEKAQQYAADAKSHFLTILFVSPRADQAWVEAPRAEYLMFVENLEIDMKKKREIWKESIREETKAIELAENSGYPRIIAYAHHILSFCLKRLGYIETNLEDKKKLLGQDIEHRKYALKIEEQIHPFVYWGLGTEWAYLSGSQAEMARAEEDPHRKETMFEEVISNLKRGLQLCNKEVVYAEKRGDLAVLAFYGGYLSALGRDQTDLYALTIDTAKEREAIGSFEEAAEWLQKAGRLNQVAECYWSAAKNYGDLREHLKAAEKFVSASENYRTATEKVPWFRQLYEDHAGYMQAWGEIEKAKHYHSKQDYGSAAAHFEKAANLHASLRQWKYLAPNYWAWTRVEQAEEFSRKDQSENAIKAFEEATELFFQTKESIQTELKKIEDSYERNMATSLIKASEIRREYCLGRIALEEARILDKKGDHCDSSEKYGNAAEKFDHIAKILDVDQDKKELELVTTFSLAWQKMAQAESETSPSLYSEASQLFEKAKELSSNEKGKMLALGHSHLCEALEAGAKFTDTRDMAEHSKVMQHLEIAMGYYLKADFQTASDYTKATRSLFDAYVHMGNAARETDPEKKTRLYTLAQKLLQTSADAYAKADNPSRKEQVLKLLETANEQRELAFSLAEVLRSPMVTSTTAFATPSPTSEKATGLERFDHAEVNANLISNRKELKVGETLDLEIELANAGKGQALLTQIEKAVPESFEVTVKPELYRIEGHNINMKGKRLDSLKTEEIKFSVKPKHRGSFTISPRIMYLDENGNAKSHQPEQLTITVKELGIKGWIAGDS